MRPGYDILGAAHRLFPVEAILNEIPLDAPIGWFWDTFGPSANIFERMLSQGRTVFRVQCHWSDGHKIVPLGTLEKVLKEIDAVAKGREIQLYASPSCEHAESDKGEVRTRLEMVKRILPYATPVNNPQPGKGAVVPGYLTEFHGGSPGKCDLASTDGDNIYDINAQKWLTAYGNKTHPCFLWGRRFNLREIEKPGQKPPPIPARKAAPSLKYFLSIKRLASPAGVPGPTKLDVRPFIGTYKSHAEDTQEADEKTPDHPRENKPVLITKGHGGKAEILTSNGRVIGNFVWGGYMPDGMVRYYAGGAGGVGLYGYEIGEKAKRLSGSEFVYFRIDGVVRGPVHPAFRQGTFR